MSDTPMPRGACPECETTLDFGLDITIAANYCDAHKASTAGLDDALVGPSWWASGSAEVSGEENRAACALIHRDRAEVE